MDKDTLDDLKQFITATVSQQIGGLEQKVDGLGRKVDGLEQKLDNLELKVDNLEIKIEERFEENDEKLDEILNVLGHNQVQVDGSLADHEQRIVKLEQKAA